MSASHANRRSVSLWVSPEDDQALDALLARYPGATRHLLGVAIYRAGLRALAANPEQVLEHLQDHARATRIRMRGA